MGSMHESDSVVLAAARPAGIDAAEWEARIELAAFYRLVDWFGWTELVFNHISLRVPQTEAQFLINPYGLWYSEVTARNLVKVGADGQRMDASTADLAGDVVGEVNPAGFVIHGAVHAARADAHCIIHTHTTAGCAVAAKKDGLRHDNFYSAALAGQVAYHDFEGITSSLDEQPRLVQSLGSRSLMILRNHGLLAIGPTVASAFRNYWRLQRACEIQATSDAMAGESLPVDASVLDRTAQRVSAFEAGRPFDQVVFNACLRKAGISLRDLV
jgi:ribulose-5-phosphate 4-epimerase/fuculose-1-phosphate aldolase